MKLEEFLKQSWNRYIQLTPDAPIIHELLDRRGELIINDHIAYRTFNIKGIDRLSLGTVFEQWGYQKADDDLDFPDKKLKASYWIHPEKNLPKVFISELLVESFSNELQSWVKDLGASALKRIKEPSPELFLETTWNPVRIEDYQRFYEISEYAAWTAAFGIQLNHFTVLVNSLRTFSSLQDLNEFLISNGMKLNQQGGIVKGTPKEFLEQSSTVAKKVPWKFADGKEHPIMGCYYEFARRYELPNTSKLFQGFIPKSADKIFESTFEKNEKN